MIKFYLNQLKNNEILLKSLKCEMSLIRKKMNKSFIMPKLHINYNEDICNEKIDVVILQKQEILNDNFKYIEK